MKKRIIILGLLFLTVLFIYTGIQATDVNLLNTEAHPVLASELEAPTLPDPEDYIYHTGIRINAETLDDIIEEFDGKGTRWCPLKISGLYFEYSSYGNSFGVFINTDVEDIYIDIENCLFIGLNEGILSYPSSGRVRIKNCVFIDNKYGVYLSEHAEQIVEDCLFYGDVGPWGASLFLEEAFHVTVKDCDFYGAKSVFITWLSPTSRFEIKGCNIYICFLTEVSTTCGIDIMGSAPGEDGAIVISNNQILGIWDYGTVGISIGEGSQGVIVKNNEIFHCQNPIWIQNGACFNLITNNYIHNTDMENGMSIEGHHNIIKSNKIENVGNEICCYPNSYENEITWNVFLESYSTWFVFDEGENNLWDYNYYSVYEGDGTDPYSISGNQENQDIHPLGPELTCFFWIQLFLQYPREVVQMWRWLR